MKLNYEKFHSIAIILGLVISAFILYLLDYLIFGDLKGTISSTLLSIAFIPIQLVLNTILIDWIVERQEEIKYSKKINVLIGVFFNECGTKILKKLIQCDRSLEKMKKKLKQEECLNERCLEAFKEELKYYNPEIVANEKELLELDRLLKSNRKNFVDLLVNPILKEDEELSEALMALIHLEDELTLRCPRGLEEYEIEHIKSDFTEAYIMLAIQWCEYMKYLNEFYPNLFSLAAINSPFDDDDKKTKDRKYMLCEIK